MLGVVKVFSANETTCSSPPVSRVVMPPGFFLGKSGNLASRIVILWEWASASETPKPSCNDELQVDDNAATYVVTDANKCNDATAGSRLSEAQQKALQDK